MMGFIFGLLKKLLKWTLYLVIFFGIVVLIPNLPPYSAFTSIELEPTLPREGPLAPNGAMNNAQHLYLDKLLGPEAFQILDGEVYTSLATGEIVKISPGGHITFVTKLGHPCTGLLEEEKCGRPLDFKIDAKERKLLVADAYHGIWKVDLKTDKKQLLVSPRVEAGGRLPRIFNSIALLGNNGDFVWSDSCDFLLKDGSYCMMTDPSGRLFKYSAATNASTLLLDGLWFANGVAVSPDQTFVLVAETARYRLQKYYLAGPKKGKSEVFVAGLPGTPDNVRALPDGSGVLVALYAAFDERHPLLTRSLAQTPLLRKFLARLNRLVEAPFEFLHAQFPHVIFQSVVYHIGNFRSISGFLPPLAGLVQIDWDGNVVATYYNTDQSLSSISDAIVYNDKLYVGSPHNNYIGSVPAPELLKKAFAPLRSSSPPAPKVDKPKQEQPKPKPVQENAQEKKEGPKVETPKVQQKREIPKADTPKVEKKEAPKVNTAKVHEKREAPKVDAGKVQTPKPPSKTPQQVKPTETPKSTTAKPVEAKKETKPTAKPTEKPTTPPPKPAETKPSPKQKPAEPKEQKTKKVDSQIKQGKSAENKAPEQIPIEEEIPSDTAKPSKETLKVIKKGGPVEIPNPKV